MQRHTSKSTMRVLLIVRYSALIVLAIVGEKTQLFLSASLEDLVRHGLHALRETLQQDKELNVNNTSIGIVGPASVHEKGVVPAGPFRILENEAVEPFLQTMIAKDTATGGGAVPPPAAAATGDEDVQMAG